MIDLRRTLREGGRFTARNLARAVFVVLLAGLIFVSIAANSIIVAILAAVFSGLMIRAILPTGRIQGYFRSLATGERGDDWYDDAESRRSSIWRRLR